jgi:hypothetical protein
MPGLHPNPPRLITVAIAVALGVVGLALALPLAQAVDVVRPVIDVTAGFGLGATRETGYLALFLSGALLVIGSLLPGI